MFGAKNIGVLMYTTNIKVEQKLTGAVIFLGSKSPESPCKEKYGVLHMRSSLSVRSKEPLSAGCGSKSFSKNYTRLVPEHPKLGKAR